jgi:hypothetical protein
VEEDEREDWNMGSRRWWGGGSGAGGTKPKKNTMKLMGKSSVFGFSFVKGNFTYLLATCCFCCG